MEATIDGNPNTTQPGRHSELEDLQLEALVPASLVGLATAYGIFGYLGVVADAVDAGAALVGASLLLTVVVSAWLNGRSPRLAAGILVAGYIGSLSLALQYCPTVGVATVFAPIIVLAGVVLGWRPATIAALAATVVILSTRELLGAGFSLEVILLLLVIWSGLPLSWLLTRPTRIALEWAWHSYDQALTTTQELRRRQEELGRLSKSLRETCDSLDRLNFELDEARRGAEEARRLKAQFAASISHELRTPLNLIIGFSEMMVLMPAAYHGETLPERYRGDVEAIYRNACHLSNLVDDVLELSQIDANRLGLERESAALQTIVDEAVAAVGGLFHDKQLTLVTHTPASLPNLYLDRTRIRQVLINLLNNAARFTEEGGVRVSAECDGHDVVVSVADTGVGIPPEDAPRVFEEFHQVRSSGRSSLGGTGLGLAIARRFIELHGGSMWVESTPGVGSTFRFSLPLCDNVAVLPMLVNWSARVRQPDDPGRFGKVMVLGDEPGPARILQRHLDGYEVVPVTSASEAYRRACDGQARAVLMTSPTAAIEWQRLESSQGRIENLPILTCTWRTARDARDKLGVADYLVKPVTRDSMEAALRRLGRRVWDIVVVDDEPEMLRLLRQMIVSISPRYRVRTAFDGASALAVLRESCPDAVILDLIMPGLDGYAVLAEVQRDERLRTLPVIVVTAKGLEDEAVVATAVSVSRAEGLSVAEAVYCLKTNLDGLLRPSRRSIAPEQRAGFVA